MDDQAKLWSTSKNRLHHPQMGLPRSNSKEVSSGCNSVYTCRVPVWILWVLFTVLFVAVIGLALIVAYIGLIGPAGHVHQVRSTTTSNPYALNASSAHTKLANSTESVFEAAESFNNMRATFKQECKDPAASRDGRSYGMKNPMCWVSPNQIFMMQWLGDERMYFGSYPFNPCSPAPYMPGGSAFHAFCSNLGDLATLTDRAPKYIDLHYTNGQVMRWAPDALEGFIEAVAFNQNFIVVITASHLHVYNRMRLLFVFKKRLIARFENWPSAYLSKDNYLWLGFRGEKIVTVYNLNDQTEISVTTKRSGVSSLSGKGDYVYILDKQYRTYNPIDVYHQRTTQHMGTIQVDREWTDAMAFGVSNSEPTMLVVGHNNVKDNVRTGYYRFYQLSGIPN